MRLQPRYASLIGGAPRRSSGSLAKFAAARWRLVLGEPLQAYSIVRAGTGVPGKLAFRICSKIRLAIERPLPLKTTWRKMRHGAERRAARRSMGNAGQFRSRVGGMPSSLTKKFPSFAMY